MTIERAAETLSVTLPPRLTRPAPQETCGRVSSVHMKHAVHQHAHAPIEFRLPKWLSEHRLIAVRLAKILLAPRNEHECDALGIESLGHREHVSRIPRWTSSSAPSQRAVRSTQAPQRPEWPGLAQHRH